MYNLDITAKCYSEDCGGGTTTRYIFKKKLTLKIEPKCGLSIIDNNIRIGTKDLTYNVQQDIFYTNYYVCGAERYYSGDPYEYCQDIVNKYKNAGWDIKRIESSNR